MINGLDLFSGIGGLTLALSEWVRPIAYCENDRYAQCVLLSLMQRNRIPRAPIWDDVRTLRLSERLDIIYGGFPCQDISAAGTGAGLDGGSHSRAAAKRRGMWPTLKASDGAKGIRTAAGAARERLRRKNGLDLPTVIGGRPSPIWCEWFMGYPSQWTELEDWAMQWFRSKRGKRSKGLAG